MTMLFATVVLLVTVLAPSLSVEDPSYCTGDFTCAPSSLLSQVAGVHRDEECRDLCSADPLCHAFTFWTGTSLVHWNQCWLFSSCQQLPCQDCFSGTEVRYDNLVTANINNCKYD